MGLFGGSSDKGYAAAYMQNLKNQAMYDSLELPEYDEYNPELYNIESANYELMTEDPVTKSMQMSALAKMAGLAESGMSDVDAAGYAEARSLGNQQSRAGTQAAVQDAQNRGVAGSGMEFAMREIANQGGAERSNKAALQQAADSARQRALYAQAYGQQVSGMRDQDARTSQANTNVINQFNQANTNARNANNAANVDQRSSAFMYNEALKDKNYQNQVGVVDRKAGLNKEQAQISAAQAAAEAKKRQAMGSAIGGLAGSYFGPAGAAAGAGIGGSIA